MCCMFKVEFMLTTLLATSIDNNPSFFIKSSIVLVCLYRETHSSLKTCFREEEETDIPLYSLDSQQQSDIKRETERKI